MAALPAPTQGRSGEKGGWVTSQSWTTEDETFHRVYKGRFWGWQNQAWTADWPEPRPAEALPVLPSSPGRCWSCLHTHSPWPLGGLSHWIKAP